LEWEKKFAAFIPPTGILGARRDGVVALLERQILEIVSAIQSFAVPQQEGVLLGAAGGLWVAKKAVGRLRLQLFVLRSETAIGIFVRAYWYISVLMCDCE